MRPKLLAIGGAHVDRRGQVTGDYVAAASNPGRMTTDFGGGAFNAVRVAALRGVGCSILSLRGGDEGGTAVAAAIQAAGIADLSVCYLDRATPSYTALLDRDGELIAALADMSLYDLAFAKQLGRRAFRDAVAGADALLVDANLPETALERVSGLASGKPVHAIGVSPAKVVRLRAIVPSIACVFLNRAEARALAGAAQDTPPSEIVASLIRIGFRRGVVTAGATAVHCFETKTRFAIEPPRVDAVVDVTGAGDALAGAAIAALMRGLAFPDAVREGIAAASLAVTSPRAVADFDDAIFDRALIAVASPAFTQTETDAMS